MSGADRPICTADQPAPKGMKRYAYADQWDTDWKHPDAIGECIDDDHDDWRYDCPNCGGVMIYEGPATGDELGLAACPFCGDRDQFNPSVSPTFKYAEPGETGKVGNPAAGLVDAGRLIECDKCGCLGPIHNTAEEAITAWNIRAQPPAPVEPASGDSGREAYTEQALADAQIDFLENRADEWMADTDVQRMFNAIASVFEKYAPQEIMDRFREKLNAIGRQCHVEGALRVWEEICVQQRAIGAPLPADAAALAVPHRPLRYCYRLSATGLAVRQFLQDQAS